MEETFPLKNVSRFRELFLCKRPPTMESSVLHTNQNFVIDLSPVFSFPSAGPLLWERVIVLLFFLPHLFSQLSACYPWQGKEERRGRADEGGKGSNKVLTWNDAIVSWFRQVFNIHSLWGCFKAPSTILISRNFSPAAAVEGRGGMQIAVLDIWAYTP